MLTELRNAVLAGDSLGIVASLVAGVWQRPARGQTLIEVLRIVSCPFVVLILGLAAGTAFQKERTPASAVPTP